MYPVDYDPDKNKKNIEKHGCSFRELEYLDWDRAIYRRDTRKEYGEDRWLAYLFKSDRLHMVCFTMRDKVIRVISFRKANKREIKVYDEETLYD